jgi:hypothetical protein
MIDNEETLILYVKYKIIGVFLLTELILIQSEVYNNKVEIDCMIITQGTKA